MWKDAVVNRLTDILRNLWWILRMGAKEMSETQMKERSGWCLWVGSDSDYRSISSCVCLKRFKENPKMIGVRHVGQVWWVWKQHVGVYSGFCETAAAWPGFVVFLLVIYCCPYFVNECTHFTSSCWGLLILLFMWFLKKFNNIYNVLSHGWNVFVGWRGLSSLSE